VLSSAAAAPRSSIYTNVDPYGAYDLALVLSKNGKGTLAGSPKPAYDLVFSNNLDLIFSPELNGLA
jgi:hypothetical protein